MTPTLQAVPDLDMRANAWTASRLLEHPEEYAYYEAFYEAIRAKDPGALLGVYHNPYRGGEPINLVDRGDRFIGLLMPTRSGKDVSFNVPNGFGWAHGGWWTDPRGETKEAVAYYRRHILGQLIFSVDPFNVDGTASRWNPMNELRAKTVFEVQDSLAISTATHDPDGTGFDGDSGIWKKRARDLSSALKLHILWCPEIKEKSYRSLINLVTLPGESTEESGRLLKSRLEAIRDYHHDPQKIYGFRDLDGKPTASHPYIASCLQQQIDRPPNEGGSVVSEMLTAYGIYRDPVLGANTAASDFSVDDMMHGTLPASLFYNVAPRNLETARPYTRLLLNLLINNTMRDVVPGIKPYRWKVAAFLNEFTAYGKLSLLLRQFAYIAAHGWKPFIIAQDIVQIKDVYGQFAPLLANLHAVIFGYMNDDASCKEFSEILKNRTIGRYNRSEQSDGRFKRKTLTEEVKGIPFIAPNDIMNLPEDEAILRLAARKPIPIKKLPYYEEASGFKERVAIWSSRGQKPDRIPFHLQVGQINRHELEREYIDFCRRQDHATWDFEANLNAHERDQDAINRAIEEALSTIGREAVA